MDMKLFCEVYTEIWSHSSDSMARLCAHLTELYLRWNCISFLSLQQTLNA